MKWNILNIFILVLNALSMNSFILAGIFAVTWQIEVGLSFKADSNYHHLNGSFISETIYFNGADKQKKLYYANLEKTDSVLLRVGGELTQVNKEFLTELTSWSRKIGEKLSTTGNCLSGVASALDRTQNRTTNFYNLTTDSGVKARKNGINPGKSAAAFGEWAENNPASLCQNFSLVQVDGLEMKAGYVTVYKPGSCGFSEKYGHIEIVTGRDEACSDHCRNLRLAKVKNCKPDLVFAPINSCGNLKVASGVVASN